MLNAEVTVNNEKVADVQELKQSLASKDGVEHIMCDREESGLDVEFSEAGAAFIVWTDMEQEEVYYFDNGSGNVNSVELLINACPEERMMCYDFEIIKDIIFYYCETGERNPKYNWIKDAME